MGASLAATALAAVAAVTLLVIAATPGVAEAHAAYERSSPAEGAVVPVPATVEIWFTQELFRREGANTITVEGPDGRVDDGNSILDPDDRTHLTVALAPDLPPGEYRVSWTTLSAIDGDSAEGEFAFTVDPTAPEPTPAGSEATPPSEATPAGSEDATAVPPPASDIVSDTSSFPTWVLVAAASILASAALGAWALLRGEPDAEGDRPRDAA